MKNTMLLLKLSQLTPHPKNMRVFFPAAQVKEMSDSIAANKGVLMPLRVVKDKEGKYLVVDGNMRLAGAKLLGTACPLLKAEEVREDQADQALAMVTSNKIRYDVDPVSEGLHFARMQKEDGLNVREISKRTGVAEYRIRKTLVLAELDEPIRKLIVDDKLPSDSACATALLRLPAATRIKLATRLAQNPGVKVKTVLTACEALLKGGSPARLMKRPAVELSGAEQRKGNKAAQGLRDAAMRTCHKCSQYDSLPIKVKEPAWSMVMHAADETCGACPMKTMQNVCGNCPAVELLRKLTVPGKE